MTDSADSRPPLDTTKLPDLLGDPIRLAYAVEALASTDSTNRVVADRARAGAPEGLVVVAEAQTAGRGRLARTWETPPGAALTFSVLLRPKHRPEEWPWLSLLAAIGVARGLTSLGLPGLGVAEVGVKWPNDVLVWDHGVERKVAGLLLERVETDRGPAAVLGIGINIDQTSAELPVPTTPTAGREVGCMTRRVAPSVPVIGEAPVRFSVRWRRGRARSSRRRLGARG